MWRYLLIIPFFIKICLAQTSIGVTNLYYSSGHESTSISLSKTSYESNASEFESKFNDEMTSKLKLRIMAINTLLNQQLVESGAFNVFDGDNILKSWLITESNLVTKWEYESGFHDTDISSESSSESALQIKPHLASNKYLLVGFIKNISANQVKQIFPGTDHKSILYSLNIDIKYMMIDIDDKKVVTQFVASGHGGIARIIPTNLILINQNSDDISDNIVTDAINSLVLSVKHGLIVKQQILK